MVRTLPGALTTALAQPTKRPTMTLTLEDRVNHLSVYQSPAQADQWSDCCVANDGSLIRVSVTRNNFTSDFQYARITDPSVAGQWTSYTNFSGSAGKMYQDSSCAVSNSSGTLRAFAQRGTGGSNLWTWTSTNNGASWTGPVSVLVPPGGALIKGIGSSGQNDVFFLYDVVGGEAMGCSFISGGVWSAINTWTLTTISAGAGVTVYYDAGSSLYRVIYTDSYALYSLTRTLGGTWTAGSTIMPTTSTSVGSISPRLAYYDGIYHLICCEFDAGIMTGSAKQYYRVRESSDFVHWSNGWLIPDITNTYGANLLYLAAPQSGSSGARSYCIAPATVMSTPAYNQANSFQYLDVSSSILSSRKLEPLNKPAMLEVVIDNTSGVYNGLVNLTGGSSYQPIGPNATMRLSEGYYTGSPPTTKTTIATGIYHLQEVQFERSPESNHITLRGYDVGRHLTYEARWQNTWTSQTVTWLLDEVAARSGILSYSVSAPTSGAQVIASYTIQAGKTYEQALRSALDNYSIAWFVDQTETIQLRERSTSDASVWTYQPEIEAVSFGLNDMRANHVIVSGKQPSGGIPGEITSAEQIDTQASHTTGQERLLHFTDQKLTSVAQCSIKAQLLLYDEQRAQGVHSIIVPFNPALQLLDVLTITDSAAPTGSGQSVLARIIQLETLYDAQRAIYEHKISLEAR